jgi:hypothetical protein
MLLPLLWRLRCALSYDVATWADTSSNQASKDPGYLRRGYSNLGKNDYIDNAIPVAAVAGLGQTLPENSVSRHPPTSKIWQPAHFWLLATCQFCTAGFSFLNFIRTDYPRSDIYSKYLTRTSSSYGVRYCCPWAFASLEGRPGSR